ncbi:glycosyltransferase family 4 protein [Streptomyces sp. NPDC006739]|uniref:glycosyltransferase family 4 protein n=1 Tax=Streptomyces sp. NPDC006739 TaxID=3364763 RepID=UPI0036A4B583
MTTPGPTPRRPPPAAPSSSVQPVRPYDTAARLRRLLGAPEEDGPAILDWHTGAGLAALLPEYPVFAPHGTGLHLPYLDHTIDTVVMAAGDLGRLEEARRVARRFVLVHGPTGLIPVWSATPPRTPPRPCPTPVTGARRVLLCAPQLPDFDRQSGSRRMQDFLRLFTDTGVQVTFLTDSTQGQQRYADLLRRRGVVLRTTAEEGWPRMLASGRFDVAVVAFWHLAERLLPVLRAYAPDMPVVVDSVDLEFLRLARRARLSPEEDDPDQRRRDRAAELAVYAAADAVLTVSQAEAARLRASLPEQSSNVFVAPDGEAAQPGPARFADRRGIIFLANFWHRPNIDGLDYLADEIVPRLDRELLAEHPLLVVGNGADERVAATVARIPHGELVGWVPSVVPYLHRARVAVLPLRFGAGTKRKLIQALLAGTPAVSSTVGIEGLPVHDAAELLVADGPDDFAAATARLLREPELWRRLAEAGRRAVTREHDLDVAAESFATAIRTVLSRRGPVSVRPSPTNTRRRVLVVGVVLAEVPNNAAATHAELAVAREHVVEQRWAAIGRIPDGIPDSAIGLTVEEMVPKCVLIARLLRDIDLDAYDHLVVCDDDMTLPAGFLDRFLELQSRCGFSLAQPARTESSYIDHPIVQRQPGVLARQTLFVESGPMVSMDRSAFPHLLPLPSESPMGWGLEEVWSRRLTDAGLKLGIVDDVPVEHGMRRPTTHYRWQDAERDRQHLLAAHPHRPLADCLRVLDVIASEPQA